MRFLDSNSRSKVGVEEGGECGEKLGIAAESLWIGERLMDSNMSLGRDDDDQAFLEECGL